LRRLQILFEMEPETGEEKTGDPLPLLMWREKSRDGREGGQVCNLLLKEKEGFKIFIVTGQGKEVSASRGCWGSTSRKENGLRIVSHGTRRESFLLLKRKRKGSTLKTLIEIKEKFKSTDGRKG